MCLHERESWADFAWDERAIAPLLGDARFAQGKLLGRLEGVGLGLSREIEVGSLSAEVIASSGVEGVQLDAAKARSSVARRPGVDRLAGEADTRNVDGAVGVALDAAEGRDDPLTAERLFGWHAALFPAGCSGPRKIRVAAFRASPMDVASGPVGHERVRFEAPPAQGVPGLMDDLLTWFNAEPGCGHLVKAGLAHLRFLTVRPSEGGSGRVARALTEMLLARSDGSPRRFYGMAGCIAANRGGCYGAVERARKGAPDATRWLVWFLSACKAAIEASYDEAGAVLARSPFRASLDSAPLNERQRKALSLPAGDLEGKLTARKWAKLCKVSPDTALRDVNDLIAKGVLVRDAAGGRSTSYSLR